MSAWRCCAAAPGAYLQGPRDWAALVCQQRLTPLRRPEAAQVKREAQPLARCVRRASARLGLSGAGALAAQLHRLLVPRQAPLR